jgi:putative endonuclease
VVAPRQKQGGLAEARAEQALVAQGMTPVARNVRCRGGEVDLVMRDGAEWVFVEVRSRAHRRWGGALASVDARKQARLALAAQTYLLRCFGSAPWPPCRFDVVAFEGADMHWVRGAFAPG